MLCDLKGFHDVDRAVSVVRVRSAELVSLADVKAHLRLAHDFDDAYVSGLIKAARAFSEKYCNRSFVQQELALVMDRFPRKTDVMDAVIYVPRSPVLSISSISYFDGDGQEQVLSASDYVLDAISVPARILPAPGKAWPSVQVRLNAVSVSYIAGILENDSDPGAVPDLAISERVPDDLRHAQLLLIEHFYNNRAPVSVGPQAYDVPFSVNALLAGFMIDRG